MSKVETNKTFHGQFGKRTQRIGESVEDNSAERKRIYDKAYPGRNPEMRRQLLLQQFLAVYVINKPNLRLSILKNRAQSRMRCITLSHIWKPTEPL